MALSDDNRQSSSSPSDSSVGDIYRGEALEYYAHYQGDRGAPLRISPAWTRWAYWLLVATVAAGLLFVAVGTVHEYAAGPAVTRGDGRIEITVAASGTIEDILVRPGQRVAANELLVRLDERSISAPRAGVVSDMRIRAGQHVRAGEVLFALNGDDMKWGVVALFPGQYRPMLRPGLTMRFAIDGHRFAYRDLTIDSVGDEVVGPSEARRFLGQALADTVPIHGPVVLVHAYLPSNTFTVDRHTYQYYEGLPGNAEARIDTDRILTTLLPGLRQLFETGRD